MYTCESIDRERSDIQEYKIIFYFSLEPILKNNFEMGSNIDPLSKASRHEIP